MASVVALHLKRRKGECERVPQLKAVAGYGFEGDYTAGSGERQALLVSTESLSELGYKPGQLKEQITVDLPDLQSIPTGARLRVGPVDFEIVGNCAPCARMAAVLGEDPDRFKDRASGKRGMLARILSDGLITVGDAVELS